MLAQFSLILDLCHHFFSSLAYFYDLNIVSCPPDGLYDDPQNEVSDCSFLLVFCRSLWDCNILWYRASNNRIYESAEKYPVWTRAYGQDRILTRGQ